MKLATRTAGSGAQARMTWPSQQASHRLPREALSAAWELLPALQAPGPERPPEPQRQEWVTTPTLQHHYPPGPKAGRPQSWASCPAPTARPAKPRPPARPLGNFSWSGCQLSEGMPRLNPIPLGSSLVLHPKTRNPTAPATEPGPRASGSSSDALLALLDPLNTTWSGSPSTGPYSPKCSHPIYPPI